MNDIPSGPAAIRLVRIIWLAIFASILIYALITFMTLRQPSPAPFESAFSNPLVLGFHLAGVGLFFAAFVVSSVVLRDGATPSPSYTPVASPETVNVTVRMRKGLIARWALIESVAIFGLVVAFMSQDARLFLPLFALSVAGMLASYPSDSMLRKLTPS